MKKFIVTAQMRSTVEFFVDAEDQSEALAKFLKGDCVEGPRFSEVLDDAIPPEVREAASDPEVIRVDLKWSAWSKDHGCWDDHAPGIWEKLAALPIGQVVTVRSSPRKEIRYGTVEISHVAHPTRPEGFWEAQAMFQDVWDSSGFLAGSLGLEDEEGEDAMCEKLHIGLGDSFSIEVSNQVEAPTFEKLMAAIDRIEDDLIAQNTETWEELEAWAKGYVKRKEAEKGE